VLLLAPAVLFWQVVLAIHILAVVIAFGIMFVYPLFTFIGLRLEARAMPSFHRMQRAVHMKVSAPSLVVIVLAGIYLASDLHQWKHFFVQWGLAASIGIGGIGGGYLAPREERLAELAEAELASSAGAEVAWSADYLAIRRQAGIARNAQSMIAALTVLFMTLHTG
jgi:hypothetical protein